MQALQMAILLRSIFGPLFLPVLNNDMHYSSLHMLSPYCLYDFVCITLTFASTQSTVHTLLRAAKQWFILNRPSLNDAKA